jgi:response regulator RpfG family c-di-GMP phosphodiesterase
MQIDPLTPSNLMALISLTLGAKEDDVYHSWRVGLVAYSMAGSCSPEERSAILFAGMLHEMAKPEVSDSVPMHSKISNQFVDAIRNVKQTPVKTLLHSVPGLELVTDIASACRERWDGSGSPKRLQGDQIPYGAQLIHLADAADDVRCFKGLKELESALWRLHASTGSRWSKDVWSSFLTSLRDGTVKKEIMDDSSLSTLVIEAIQQRPCPK